VTRGLTRWLWVAIATALVVLPLPPLAVWSGAPDQGPGWAPHMVSWGIGIFVVVVLAIVAGRLATRGPDRLLPRINIDDRWYVGGLALLVTVASAVASSMVFARNPHLVDEMAQLLHARAFAAGRLALPVPEPAAAFVTAHTWVTEAGWISQYPPGHTVLLTLGLLARAEWLVGPLLSGVGAIAVFFVARGLFGRQVARAAVFLWAASAWVVFMSASYMNHVGAVTFALVGWACIWGPRQVKGWQLFLGGVALACATATRPLDGVAAALPVLVWMARRRWSTIGWFALGGVPVALAWGYVNWRLHGSPATLGYSVLYGKEHGLGFHIDPWGRPFTPAVALSNAAVAIRRLHLYLFEWPIPAVLPLGIWAACGRHRTEKDLILAVGLITAPFLYFFYWHSGFFLGPRFYYTIAPWLLIGTARAWWWGWSLARRARGRLVRWDIAMAAAAMIVLVWGWAEVFPARVAQYRSELPTFKLHPEQVLRDAGVQRAVVLVPTSWGSRIITDLWAIGVKPGVVERAYRQLDACVLDRVRRRARLDDTSAEAVAQELERLIQARPVAAPQVPLWPDPYLRLDLSIPKPAHCRAEMARDLAGFTTYANLAWRSAVGLEDGIVYARDLFEKNEELLSRYPGWPVWRYAPLDGDPYSLPVMIPPTPTRFDDE